MIVKSFGGSVKDVDAKTRTVTGYFSTFDFKDSDGDIILPGAFRKSVAERGPEGAKRIFHLWQHRTDMVLGKPTILKEDTQGLYFETVFPADERATALQTDALKLYEQGILNEHSIGFEVIQHERNKDTDTTLLKELKLWEGSVVTWGANERTPMTGIKAGNLDELQDRLKRLEDAIRGGKFRDDTFELLQIELSYIQGIIKSLEGDGAGDEPPLPVEPTIEQLIQSFKKGLSNG